MPPTGQLARALTVRFLETGFPTVSVEAFSERAFIVPPSYSCSTTYLAIGGRCNEAATDPGLLYSNVKLECSLPHTWTGNPMQGSESAAKDNAPRKDSIWLELLVLSLVSLYLELLIIRWMSADIRALTIFRTFPLVTCFVGLGAGFALGSDRAFKFTPYALCVFVLTMKLAEQWGISLWSFPTTGIFQWGGLLSYNSAGPYIVLFMAVLVVLLAGPFAACVCIGSRLGVLFNRLDPLKAYLVNLFGALLGSVLFTALCYMGVPPVWLVIPAAGVVAWYMIKGSGADWKPLAAICVLFLLALWTPQAQTARLAKPLMAYRDSGPHTYWSPYQRLDLTLFKTPDAASAKDSFLALELSVNRMFYQFLFNDQAVGALDRHTADIFADRLRQYSLPFTLTQARDVLVVGSGTGQNVLAAVRHGASWVDAVEIDPQILKFGQDYNSAYNHPGVNAICDDARHFFNVTDRKYDLIVFGLLDSHAVIGQGSSVRVDTYVYTRESIKHAISLLKPGGLVVVSFCALAPWMKDRLAMTMQEASDYEPLVIRDRKSMWGNADIFFVVGDPVKNGQLKAPAGWDLVTRPGNEKVRILTDDWPYLYVQPDVLDIPYLLIVAEILLISVWAARRVLFGPKDASMWQMFFLGAAFMLLELHAISRLSLLFGSTWLTSAIAINGILILIMLANVLVMRGRELFRRRLPFVYLALFASIGASYLLPDKVLSAGASGQFLVTFVTLLPMGVAGILFACLFAPVTEPHRAMAFNLLGAVGGGLLEYLSNYTGIRGLELVAGGLYLLSWICSTKIVATWQKAPAVQS